MHVPAVGVASDMEVLEDDLHVDGERLEENEELKLHVLGLQTFWTQYLTLEINLVPFSKVVNETLDG